MLPTKDGCERADVGGARFSSPSKLSKLCGCGSSTAAIESASKASCGNCADDSKGLTGDRWSVDEVS